MIEVKIPKFAWLSSAKVEFLKGGYFDGALALSLTFSGKEVSPSDAALALSVFLSLRLPVTRLVRFSGDFPERDENFLIFMKSFQKYGFKVIVVTANDQLATWMDTVDWLTIKTVTPLLMAQPNEVWYSPVEDIFPDLTMPTMSGKLTFFYFDRTKGITETEEFFCNSRYHWQLI